MPLATASSAYWICKARVAAKAARDDFTAALTVLDDAEKHHPEVVILFSLVLVHLLYSDSYEIVLYRYLVTLCYFVTLYTVFIGKLFVVTDCLINKYVWNY